MKHGDIWLVDLSDAKGHEQRGVRPGVVMGHANGMTLVVPLTTTLGTARFSHTCLISPGPHNGLDVDSIALVFQIVALDRNRFLHRIGAVSEGQRQAIIALIRDLLGLD
ncbi:type II toxin-antitoxin system PemK/MazF family toxin [Methanoregula sp.]|uniref:type II toxin-antitoxin system PemK/MazF family toxin n=1 Tax=Methanoregula sp. TaxID=2052170 RepID=UPI003C763E18